LAEGVFGALNERRAGQRPSRSPASATRTAWRARTIDKRAGFGVGAASGKVNARTSGEDAGSVKPGALEGGTLYGNRGPAPGGGERRKLILWHVVNAQ